MDRGTGDPSGDAAKPSSSPSPRRPWLLAFALILVGLAIAGLGWRATLTLPAWRTGARVVTWYGPDGEPVALEGGCEGVDITMRNVVHAGTVWTWCTGPGFGSGGLARIDAAKGEGRILWPLPGELAFGESTVGLYPGPNDQLGVVFRTQHVNGPLAVAVAGPEGWTYPPMLLPGHSRPLLLGGAWVGDALELVVHPASESDAIPIVVRVDDGELHERRPFPDRATLCPDHIGCSYLDSGARQRDGEWFLVVTGQRKGHAPEQWWVAESGARHDTAWGPELFRMVQAQIDWVDVGLTDRPSLGRRVLQPDGSVAPAPAPPRAAWDGDPWYDFETVGGRLRRRASWHVPAERFVRAQRVSGRLLATNGTLDDQPPVVSVQEFPATGDPVATPIAYEPRHGCGELGVGVFVAQADGGFALVSDSGCYVMLDAQLRRVDPLPLREHLRRRGSRGVDLDEAEHEIELLWTLGGLPLCIALAIAIAFARRFRGRRATSMGVAACVGASVYIVSGAVTLSMVLPLLR